jgi:hypothetical protein
LLQKLVSLSHQGPIYQSGEAPSPVGKTSHSLPSREVKTSVRSGAVFPNKKSSSAVFLNKKISPSNTRLRRWTRASRPPLWPSPAPASSSSPPPAAGVGEGVATVPYVASASRLLAPQKRKKLAGGQVHGALRSAASQPRSTHQGVYRVPQRT